MKASTISQSAQEPLPVAEYVRMSTEHQKYSIENQRALITAYATANNMRVTRTFVDAGKSGVTLRRREGLSSLLAEVVAGTTVFKAILVYDVSRWGRFQDADESAHYEFLCRRAGVAVIYCAEQFAQDATPLGSVLKSLKRAMAGEFSRELGTKVAAGKARLGKLGYRVGGPAGYGLRRQLLMDGTTPGLVLQPGQRKSLQTDRVTLIPGPAHEIELVQRIYRDYVYRRRSERDIAEELNKQGLSHYGKPWSRALVRTILSNEKYCGCNVVGRVQARLFTRQIPKPPDQWVRCAGAFTPLIPKELFDAAEKVRRYNEKIPITREEIIRGLRKVLRREGALSAAIIAAAPELPAANTIFLKFGSLGAAYQLAGYTQPPRYLFHAVNRMVEPMRQKLQDDLIAQLGVHGQSAWTSHPQIVSLDGGSTLEVRVCRWQGRSLQDGGWRVDYQRNAGTDFVVAQRLMPGEQSTHDYVLVPRSDLQRLPILIRSKHRLLIAPYVYQSLAAIAKKLADDLQA